MDSFRKKVSKIVAFLAVSVIMTVLAGSMFSFRYIAAKDSVTMQLSGTVRPEYYAREELKKQPDGDNLVRFYDMIVEAVEKNEKKDGWVMVYAYENGIILDKTTASAVYKAYIADHPEQFWIGSSYGHQTGTQGDNSFYLALCISTDDALYAQRDIFNDAVRSFVDSAGIKAGMPEYEKSEKLHDALARSVVYDKTAPNAHSALGAIIDKACVCEGYAECYQYLLQYCGIQAVRVTGQSINSSTGKSEGHAWNLVRLDGKYYYTDVTWDDHGTLDHEIYHNFLNVTEEYISSDHSFEPTVLYSLPEATSEDLNYFTVHGGIMQADSPDIYFIEDSISRYGYASVRVTGTNYDEKIKTAYKANISTIRNDIGLVSGSISYSNSHVGREYHLWIITSCGDLRTASHTYGVAETDVEPTCSSSGIFKQVCSLCGYLHLTEIPADGVSHEDSNDDTICDECGKFLGILGDINLDGNVDAEDLTAMARHVAKIDIISESKALLAADVNSDGLVDAEDLTILARYVAKIISEF